MLVGRQCFRSIEKRHFLIFYCVETDNRFVLSFGIFHLRAIHDVSPHFVTLLKNI